MTAILAATILWCLDHADNSASDCGLTENEVACIDTCLGDDDGPEEACPRLCISEKRIKKLQSYPLYSKE